MFTLLVSVGLCQVKPTNFPVKNPIDGSEELYTQRDKYGIANQRFYVSSIRNWLNDQGYIDTTLGVINEVTLNNTEDSLVFKWSIAGRIALKFPIQIYLDTTNIYVTRTQLVDSIINLNARTVLKLNTTDTVAQNLGIRNDYINRLTTKQDALISGTNIKTINSNSLLGSGNIVTPDAQTLTAGTNTLTISGGNTVNLNRKVDTSYQIKNTARDSTCQITIINGLTYRSCTKDTVSTLTPTSTTTFTNKRITARVDSTTSSATPTINTDNIDTYKLTAQALDITSFTTNLTGTPTDDQILHIVIIGTGARAITWGSKFESSTVTLPTTTVSTNRLDVYFIWNTATSKWRCGGVW